MDNTEIATNSYKVVYPNSSPCKRKHVKLHYQNGHCKVCRLCFTMSLLVMQPMAAFEVSHPTITKLELEVFNLHLFKGLSFYLSSPHQHALSFLHRKPDNSTLKLFLKRRDHTPIFSPIFYSPMFPYGYFYVIGATNCTM